MLWGLDNMREGVLLGHALGIRKMAYANGTLISVGFEYDAIVWDITSKASLLLRGHRWYRLGADSCRAREPR